METSGTTTAPAAEMAEQPQPQPQPIPSPPAAPEPTPTTTTTAATTASITTSTPQKASWRSKIGNLREIGIETSPSKETPKKDADKTGDSGSSPAGERKGSEAAAHGPSPSTTGSSPGATTHNVAVRKRPKKAIMPDFWANRGLEKSPSPTKDSQPTEDSAATAAAATTEAAAPSVATTFADRVKAKVPFMHAAEHGKEEAEAVAVAAASFAAPVAEVPAARQTEENKESTKETERKPKTYADMIRPAVAAQEAKKAQAEAAASKQSERRAKGGKGETRKETEANQNNKSRRAQTTKVTKREKKKKEQPKREEEPPALPASAHVTVVKANTDIERLRALRNGTTAAGGSGGGHSFQETTVVVADNECVAESSNSNSNSVPVPGSGGAAAEEDNTTEEEIIDEISKLLLNYCTISLSNHNNSEKEGGGKQQTKEEKFPTLGEVAATKEKKEHAKEATKEDEKKEGAEEAEPRSASQEGASAKPEEEEDAKDKTAAAAENDSNAPSPELELYRRLMTLCQHRRVTPASLEVIREMLQRTRVIPNYHHNEQELAATRRREYAQQLIIILLKQLREQKLMQEAYERQWRQQLAQQGQQVPTAAATGGGFVPPAHGPYQQLHPFGNPYGTYQQQQQQQAMAGTAPVIASPFPGAFPFLPPPFYPASMPGTADARRFAGVPSLAAGGGYAFNSYYKNTLGTPPRVPTGNVVYPSPNTQREEKEMLDMINKLREEVMAESPHPSLSGQSGTNNGRDARATPMTLASSGLPSVMSTPNKDRDVYNSGASSFRGQPFFPSNISTQAERDMLQQLQNEFSMQQFYSNPQAPSSAGEVSRTPLSGEGAAAPLHLTPGGDVSQEMPPLSAAANPFFMMYAPALLSSQKQQQTGTARNLFATPNTPAVPAEAPTPSPPSTTASTREGSKMNEHAKPFIPTFMNAAHATTAASAGTGAETTATATSASSQPPPPPQEQQQQQQHVPPPATATFTSTMSNNANAGVPYQHHVTNFAMYNNNKYNSNNNNSSTFSGSTAGQQGALPASMDTNNSMFAFFTRWREMMETYNKNASQKNNTNTDSTVTVDATTKESEKEGEATQMAETSQDKAATTTTASTGQKMLNLNAQPFVPPTSQS